MYVCMEILLTAYSYINIYHGKFIVSLVMSVFTDALNDLLNKYTTVYKVQSYL